VYPKSQKQQRGYQVNSNQDGRHQRNKNKDHLKKEVETIQKVTTTTMMTTTTTTRPYPGIDRPKN